MQKKNSTEKSQDHDKGTNVFKRANTISCDTEAKVVVFILICIE